MCTVDFGLPVVQVSLASDPNMSGTQADSSKRFEVWDVLQQIGRKLQGDAASW